MQVLPRVLVVFIDLFIFSIVFSLQAQNTDLERLLDLSLEQLSGVQVVTPSKIPQSIHKAPATVRVVTSEQIRERGYFTLEEALSDLPGFQFRNMSGFNSYAFLRGAPSQNNLILVLIDGVQINELNSGGFYGGGQFNLANIDRIEVVYGPSSTLYGTNAISGVINIITKDPETDHGLSAGVLGGNFKTQYGHLDYGYWNSNEDWGFRISGMAKSSDKADLAGKKGDLNWTDQLETFEDDYALDAKFRYHAFEYGFNFQNKQSSAATYNRSVGTHFLDHGTLWNIRFINSYLKHQIRLTDHADLFSRVYYRNATVLDNSVLTVLDTAQIGYYRPNDLIGYEGIVDSRILSNVRLVSGLVLETERLAKSYSNTVSSASDIRPPKPPRPPMSQNTLFSFYAQLQYDFLKSCSFVSGARFDNSSIYDRVLTPQFGLVYNRPKLTLKWLYTEAFRAPKPWDYADGMGNPDLLPEKMRALELGMNFMILPALKLDLSLYQNRLKNKLFKEESGVSWRWINRGELTTTGLETGLSYQKDSFNTYLNYTYNFSVDERDDPIPEIAKHTVNGGVEISIIKNVQISLRGQYFGERKNPKVIMTTGSNLIDPAIVFHGVLGYSLSKHIDLQLVVKNILDTEYYHPSNRPPDRYRQPERTILLQCEFRR